MIGVRGPAALTVVVDADEAGGEQGSENNHASSAVVGEVALARSVTREG